MPATITYEVMKRPAGSDGSFYLHIQNDGPLAAFCDEPAVFDDLDEAYAVAEKLAPEFETRIRVVETTIHAYFL